MNISCDVNKANLFLLESQGKIVPYTKGNLIFRHYEGTGCNRNGWLFPNDLNIQEDLKKYLNGLLELDSAPNFILLTEEQKQILTGCLETDFKDYKIDFMFDEGDSDYIYSSVKMAQFPGKDFQKKRNHVSKFLRTYGEDWKFEFYGDGQAFFPKIKDFQKIYSQWKLNNNLVQNEFLEAEEKSFNLAVDGNVFEKLNLIAGILYVDNEAAAFLIASFTGTECLNVHFEKCIEEVSANGGLAFLNQQFAKAVIEKYPECKFLNREEDLNIPGLRKSKLSYKPEFLLKKFYGKMEVQ